MDKVSRHVTPGTMIAFLPFIRLLSRFIARLEYFKCCARLRQWVGNFEMASGTMTVKREETKLSSSKLFGEEVLSAGEIPSRRV